ncbi:TPA: accessory Sec system protein translocase subunit SecY2 [Streptococcus suis]
MFNTVFRKNSLVQKALISLLIVCVFIFGRHIPLPNVPLGAYLADEDSALNLGSSVTGGSLSQIGLFSLGLGPWMYSMILLRLFSLGRPQQQVSAKRQLFRQNSIMLIIAVIQALSFAFNLSYTSTSGSLLKVVIETSLILITGSYVLLWLGNQNSVYGLGGPSLIVLVNMILSQKNVFPVAWKLLQNGKNDAFFVIVIIFWTFATLFFLVLFEKAEYRVPVKRVSINNSLGEDAYMPIKVNPAGGMPLMYAYTFLMFPQYFILLLQYFVPKVSNWSKWISYFTTNSWQGILIYGIIIFVLTISFSFVNLDTTTQAENLRNSGDYIDGVRPGKLTKKYLSRIVVYLGIFSGLFLAVMTCVPLLLALGNKNYQTVAAMTGVFMMISGMLLVVIEEVQTTRLIRRYNTLFQ